MSDGIRYCADQKVDMRCEFKRCIQVAECVPGVLAVFDTATPVDPAPVPVLTQSPRCTRMPERCAAL